MHVCASRMHCYSNFRVRVQSEVLARSAAYSPTQAVLRNLRIPARKERGGRAGKMWKALCVYIYIYIYIYMCLYMKRHGIGGRRLTLKRINRSERSMCPGPIKTARANLERNLNKSRRGGIDRSIDKLAFACRQNVTRS